MRSTFTFLSVLLCLLASLVINPTLYAQSITTLAGTGTATYSGDGGAATAAAINDPGGIFVDGSGNIFIADSYNNRIRKISTSGVITTIAGTGTAGFSGDGGAAVSAELNKPLCLVVDATGNIFFTDNNNNRVRAIVGALIETVAGTGAATSTGDGGAATGATINAPYGIAIDAAGDLFIADGGTKIRKISITTGNISTYAGTGSGGYSGDGGAPTAATMYQANLLYMDPSGNL